LDQMGSSRPKGAKKREPPRLDLASDRSAGEAAAIIREFLT